MATPSNVTVLGRHFDLYVNEKNDPIIHVIRITNTSLDHTSAHCPVLVVCGGGLSIGDDSTRPAFVIHIWSLSD